MVSNPSIALVALTFNRRPSVRELLLDVEQLRPAVLDIIVVDNCSTDGTPQMIARDFPWVNLISTKENLGACARDIGIRSTDADLVVTLDDDILGLTRASLDWLAHEFRDDPSLGALNFKVVDARTGLVGNWVHHRPATDASRRFKTYELTEGAVAIRREAYVEVGGYLVDYFIGHEGPDLAYRLMNAGYSVLYDGSVTVRHSFAEGARVPWRPYYYDTRNQFWLAVRNMPLSYGIRYLLTGLLSMGYYSLRDGFFVWYLRGIRDGIGGLPRMWKTRQCWNEATRQACYQIDRFRPSFWESVKKSLRKSPHRLDG